MFTTRALRTVDSFHDACCAISNQLRSTRWGSAPSAACSIRIILSPEVMELVIIGRKATTLKALSSWTAFSMSPGGRQRTATVCKAFSWCTRLAAEAEPEWEVYWWAGCVTNIKIASSTASRLFHRRRCRRLSSSLTTRCWHFASWFTTPTRQSRSTTKPCSTSAWTHWSWNIQSLATWIISSRWPWLVSRVAFVILVSSTWIWGSWWPICVLILVSSSSFPVTRHFSRDVIIKSTKRSRWSHWWISCSINVIRWRLTTLIAENIWHALESSEDLCRRRRSKKLWLMFRQSTKKNSASGFRTTSKRRFVTFHRAV